MPPSLDTIPLEVLEHIAFFVGWEQLSGPPRYLVSLCLTCKAIYDSLSFSCNPSFYASLFRSKFDTSAPLRRLSPEHTTAQCLAGEFRTRFAAMQRIRRGMGSYRYLFADRKADLWMAVMMMLENDGKNAIQLRTFGKVQEWLHTYLLEDSGGSFVQCDMRARTWPRDNIDNKLALWLLYLLDAEGSSPPCKLYTGLLRAYAIGANRYPLAHLWDQFSVHYPPSGTAYRHFDCQLYPIPPPATISAILGYITRLRQSPATISSLPSQMFFGLPQPRLEASGSRSSNGLPSQQWDCVWERCIDLSLGKGYLHPLKGPRYYRPGSLDGSWEGLFIYVEFGDYTAMLSGEPPQAITEATIGHNLQVWKVREYGLYSSTSSGLSGDPVVSTGSVQNAFLPIPLVVNEDGRHAVFVHSSQRSIYHRPRPPTDDINHLDQGTLRDVIIIGEGHSAWGDFKLRGRVRPSDAFVTILKEYGGGNDRGRWLYRGYIVGGKYVGRWRDVVTPLTMVGYEGGFELSKRKA